MAAWSLASPLFSSPDEPAHVVHAVALDHGQLIGTPVGGSSSAITAVTVPASIADSGRYSDCFRFRISVPASCARPLTTDSRAVESTTSAGRYPPLYYAIVGIPSLVSESTGGIYAMRLVSAALSALFVALAFMSICAWSRRTFMLVGVLLAVTPMTLFMGGVVNPNGPEICAALCMWTAGLVLVLERAEAPPRGLVIVLTASAVVLMLSRGISPLWVVLILVVLAILAGRRAIRAAPAAAIAARAHCRRGPLGCRRGGVDHRRHANDLMAGQATLPGREAHSCSLPSGASPGTGSSR